MNTVEIKGSLHLHGVKGQALLMNSLAENGIQLSMYNCDGSWSNEETHMDLNDFLSKYRNDKDVTLVKVEGEVIGYFETLKNK